MANAVSEIKQQDEGDLLMYGWGDVGHLLIQNGLLDELKLWINLAVAGEGAHLFNDATDLPVMDLQSVDRLKPGIVILTLKPRAA